MRIPVVFSGGTHRDAYLVEADGAAPAGTYVRHFAQAAAHSRHPAGCACCAARGPAAMALAEMYRARATGAAPLFKRVVVCASAAGEAAVREAMRDVLVAARYRI